MVGLIGRIWCFFLVEYDLMASAAAESCNGTIQQSTLYSCQSALHSYRFECEDGNWPCSCSYAPLMASILECMDLYLPDSVDRSTGHGTYIQACDKYTSMKITLNEIEKVRLNGTQWALDSNDTRWDHSLPVYVPIRVQRDEVQKKIRDYTAFLGNFDISQNYGLIINIYWLWALSWFGIWNKFKQTHLNARLVSPKINYLRSQISLPLFFNAHQQPLEILPNITTLLPTTAEAITLFGYFILNTAFLIHGYTITDDNQLFGQGSEVVQQIRLLADRSGILSFAHFPLLVLFAGRNNILIGLSELPYASFMMFHKWTARIMVTDALIHTFCYIVAMWLQNTLSRYFKLLWFVIGVQAIVAGIVMLLFAIHSFRVKHYEWFLITHVLFAIVFFVSCWEHCVTFGWLEWIYGAMCLWITDRLVRVYRLFRFGAPKAQIKLFSDDTFKVSVQRPHNWRPYPGCFVYLHFLHWSVFWQSHPFTIVDTILEEEEVTIYIKAKDGVTSRVMSLLQDGMITMRVSLEGPYGNQSPCENYDNVILFAGGNGIPGPFYHALHLAERSLLQKSQIRLIWVIRSIDSICWFEPELKRLYKTTIKCDIYITRGFHKSQVDSEPLLMQFRDYITFHLGRAPSKKILESEFKESQGSTAVVTCGPGLMCDEIRRIVATGIQKSEYRIDLYEELQVW